MSWKGYLPGHLQREFISICLFKPLIDCFFDSITSGSVLERNDGSNFSFLGSPQRDSPDNEVLDGHPRGVEKSHFRGNGASGGRPFQDGSDFSDALFRKRGQVCPRAGIPPLREPGRPSPRIPCRKRPTRAGFPVCQACRHRWR
jgi:hypothetical protein